MKHTRLALPLLAAFLAAAPVVRAAQPDHAEPGRKPHGKLAFVLTTAFDDMQMMNMMLQQAKIAKESGYLEDVVVVVYGRGVMAFNNIPARPAQTAQFIRAAQGAGVRFYVCNNALTKLGVSPNNLDPKPDEIVPRGIVKLSQLISDGYQVIRY